MDGVQDEIALMEDLAAQCRERLGRGSYANSLGARFIIEWEERGDADVQFEGNEGVHGSARQFVCRANNPMLGVTTDTSRKLGDSGFLSHVETFTDSRCTLCSTNSSWGGLLGRNRY